LVEEENKILRELLELSVFVSFWIQYLI
jgi:hypothetical protein